VYDAVNQRFPDGKVFIDAAAIIIAGEK